MDRPSTVDQAAAAIRELAAMGKVVCPRGGGTKLGWSSAHPPEREVVELDTRGLDRIIEHNVGDFTAVLQAGVTLQEAQAVFARSGQMLALDPPLGAGGAATLGGILATNDSGPLRHRYGSMRDLVIGITVVLSDGTVARSGGKVIKNVAGYDLAKLFTGSFGTLGLVAQLAVRLHPLAPRSTTLVASSQDPRQLAAAALTLARLPLEADCLDVTWAEGSGKLLVRFAGGASGQRAQAARSHITGFDELDIVSDDAAIWLEQRTRQRSESGIVIKVSGRATDLPVVLQTAAAAGGSVVSRAALGLSWMQLPAGADVAAIRRALAPRACTVLDGADRVADPWPRIEAGTLAVMRRIKARFDPEAAFCRVF